MAATVFVRFSLFLTSTHSKNLIHLALTISKLKILEDPFEADSPNWHPNIIRALVLPDIFIRSNFKYSAFSSLKVDTRQPEKHKQKQKNVQKRRKVVFKLG